MRLQYAHTDLRKIAEKLTFFRKKEGGGLVDRLPALREASAQNKLGEPTQPSIRYIPMTATKPPASDAERLRQSFV
jgi:hypothetical protein